MVNHSNDHKGLRLRSWFLRYSFATILLDLRDQRGFSCGKAGIEWSDQRFVDGIVDGVLKRNSKATASWSTVISTEASESERSGEALVLSWFSPT